MRIVGLSLLVSSVIVSGVAAQGHSQERRASAALAPEQEVPVVISPDATGRFTAVVDEAAQAIVYRLAFSGLQAPVTQSHIHLAQPDVNGGIVVWLCQTAAAMDPVNQSTQQCPASGGTITGIISPTDVRAVPAQGLAPTLTASERFDRLVAAMRDGNTYVNVHTVQSPGGEIRGQVQVQGSPNRGQGHDDH